MRSIYYILLLITVFVSGCARSIYTPTTPNVPLIHTKNEFQLESTIASNGINVKTAFSPVNHLSLQLNGQYTYSDKYADPQYHNYIEGAAGTYFVPNEKLFLEAYLGYGLGASNYGDASSGDGHHLTLAKGQYSKQYVQLNIGTPIGRSLFGACVRAGNVCYTYESARISALTGNTYNHLTVEPYLFLKTGAKRKLGFVTYLGLTIINGNLETIRTNVINFGIGLNLKLGRNTGNQMQVAEQ